MDFHELSLRSYVDFKSLSDFLAVSLAVDRTLVGEMFEYWDRIGTDCPLKVGVDVQWSELGYKTFLKWVQEEVICAPQLLTIALLAANRFTTEVAIGDVISEQPTPIDYVVIKPNGEVYKAVELYNGDQFELDLYTSPIEPTLIEKLIRQSD